MTFEERFEEAKRLSDEQRYGEAADLFEELAQESSDLNTVFVSMNANNLNAYLLFEIGAFHKVGTYADRVIDWAVKISQNEELMNQYNGKVIEQYRRACRYKGQAIFANDATDSNCLHPLEEAAQYGENEARYYLGIYYLLNSCEANEDFAAYSEFCAKQAMYHEEYIANLTGDEDKEKLRRICDALAALYETGTGVAKDKKKAKHYKKMFR